MEPLKTELKAFQDRLAVNLFGLTLEDAQDKNICIACKSPVDTAEWEPSAVDEYLIFGICLDCFGSLKRQRRIDNANFL